MWRGLAALSQMAALACAHASTDTTTAVPAEETRLADKTNPCTGPQAGTPEELEAAHAALSQHLAGFEGLITSRIVDDDGRTGAQLKPATRQVVVRQAAQTLVAVNVLTLVDWQRYQKDYLPELQRLLCRMPGARTGEVCGSRAEPFAGSGALGVHAIKTFGTHAFSCRSGEERRPHELSLLVEVGRSRDLTTIFYREFFLDRTHLDASAVPYHSNHGSALRTLDLELARYLLVDTNGLPLASGQGVPLIIAQGSQGGAVVKLDGFGRPAGYPDLDFQRSDWAWQIATTFSDGFMTSNARVERVEFLVDPQQYSGFGGLSVRRTQPGDRPPRP